jgi:copper chaperone CopZ
VRSLEGVVEVQASVETRFVDIDFDPSVVTPEAIEQALAAAGFPVQQ